MIQYRTYTIRLFPNRGQEQELKNLSLARNTLYNMLVGIEQKTYEETGKIKTEFDLDRDITVLRKEQPFLTKLNSKASQRVAKEVYSAYKSFFSLAKKDKTAKPPKQMKDVARFHTVAYNQTGWKFIDGNTLKLNGLVVNYKGIPGMDYKSMTVKEVKLKHVNDKYLLDLGVANSVEEQQTITQGNKVLAIDLGLKNLCNGVDNLGSVVTIPNKARRINRYFRKHISDVQSKMDRCIKGSSRHCRLKKTKRKLCNRRNTQIKQTLHIQSKKLVDMNYKTIVVGDLSVKKLMEKGSNKLTKTSRSFSESSIATFMEYLAYKCQKSNTELVTINEMWTTQQNCLTGKLFKEKVGLSDRTVRLSDSIEIDRDLNAAINIMKRYEQNHLALLTAPLDVSSVVNRHNLLTDTCS